MRCCSLDTVECISRRSCPSLGRNQGRGAEIARRNLTHWLISTQVDAVLRLKGSDNLDYIQLLKKPGGQLGDSYLAEGFVLDKKIGIGQPKRLEKAKVMVANTAMDTDKIKIYGARVKVDSLSKVAAIEQACSQGINQIVATRLRHRRDAGSTDTRLTG